MNGMKFTHIHPSDALDPIYNNNNGQPIDAYSFDEVTNTSENGGVGSASKFESQVDKIDRQLSHFIEMVIQLRSLVEPNEWTVVTRTCRSSLEVQGEVITAFLPTSNNRRTWHLIEDNNSERLRQIAWVEINLGNDNFIYLAEMELNESETGRSTLLIVPKNGEYMPEQDFEVFLSITAVQNRWPKSSHTWKSKGARVKASEYFEQYHHLALTHPAFISHRGKLDGKVIKQWAKSTKNNIDNKLESLVNLHTL